LKKILFICTGNSCRSAMAQAYMEKRLKELKRKDVTVSSAGIFPHPGMLATAETQQILAEEGIDILGHAAKKVTDSEIREADMIFAMEDIHKRYLISRDPQAEKKTYLLKDFKKIGDFSESDSPNIDDPIGKSIDFYRKTFAVIKEAVENILREVT
jgi:protein arginine phosphatase